MQADTDITDSAKNDARVGESTPNTPKSLPKKKRPGRRINVGRKQVIVAICVLILLFFVGRAFFGSSDSLKKVDVSTFSQQVGRDQIKKVTLTAGATRLQAEVYKKGKTKGKTTDEQVNLPPDGSGELTQRLIKEGIVVKVDDAPSVNLLVDMFWRLAPLLLMIGAIAYLFRSQLNFKISKERRGPVTVPDTRFSDLAGADEVREELSDIVDFLRRPERYITTNAKLPRGILLVGEPGVGKTLAARAVAGEAGVPFFALTGSDFVETYVGVGASRVRDLFDQAKKAERAIIFIDEIDSIGRERSAAPANAGTDESERTLNMLLAELDGFTTNDKIFVLAATNRPDILDPALKRPGRFDRTVIVPLPDRKGREDILELYAKRHPVAADIDYAKLAKRMPGFSGADISNVSNLAALAAARAGRDIVEEEDVEKAISLVVMGPERRSRIISERDRSITAWHEAGHAVVALCLDGANAPVQISIVPRGVAGGATWFDVDDDAFVTDRQAIATLAVMMGGRAAEERLLEGSVTQGASDDFAKATELAHRMVAEWGMGDLGAGHFSPGSHYRGATEDELRASTGKLVTGALETARTTLEAHRALLGATAERLLEEESIDGAALQMLADSIKI